MPNKDVQSVQKVVAGLVKNIAARNRDVVSRRFGLQNGKKETLESIGKSYNITRERVRQIEEFSLQQIAKSDNESVEKYANLARTIVQREGGVMKERDLFKAFSGSEKDSVANASLVFLLTLHKDFIRFNENDEFHAFWAVDRAHLDAFKKSVLSLVSSLKSHGNVIPRAQTVAFASKHNVAGFNNDSVSEKAIGTILSICKDLNQNIFGEVGLASWADVKPKGVRDKAFLIMKKEGKPRHFGDIAKIINTAGFQDGKRVNVQTVHNELIKDGRFVLVGRGMYALAEWGYKTGTVKDVLKDIIASTAKPLTRAELVAKVKDVRMVKENTILLNLQDSSHFVKNGDGTYVLRKG